MRISRVFHYIAKFWRNSWEIFMTPQLLSCSHATQSRAVRVHSQKAQKIIITLNQSINQSISQRSPNGRAIRVHSRRDFGGDSVWNDSHSGGASRGIHSLAFVGEKRGVGRSFATPTSIRTHHQLQTQRWVARYSTFHAKTTKLEECANKLINFKNIFFFLTLANVIYRLHNH